MKFTRNFLRIVSTPNLFQCTNWLLFNFFIFHIYFKLLSMYLIYIIFIHTHFSPDSCMSFLVHIFIVINWDLFTFSRVLTHFPFQNSILLQTQISKLPGRFSDYIFYHKCFIDYYFQLYIWYRYSGYGKYSYPLKFFTLCYIAAIC